MLLLKHFITKILEYKAGLNRRIKFVCVAMCSLMMSLCSRDVIKLYYNTLNSSRLTVVYLTQRLVLDGKTSLNSSCDDHYYVAINAALE